MIHPVVLHNFSNDMPPVWATFYTSATTPNPVSFTVVIPPGNQSIFDFGDGSEVLIVEGDNSVQVIEKTYTTPAAGTKITIEFSDRSALRYFYGRDMQLTGFIPKLEGMTSLTFLYLDRNQLSGPIPSLDGLVSLAWLLLYSNQLSGSIPSLDGLVSLVSLYLYDNNLSGFDGGMTGGAVVINILFNINDLTENSVNLILADSVTEGLATGDNLNLSGGTNAAPTGQGIIDKSTLIANGASVITN